MDDWHGWSSSVSSSISSAVVLPRPRPRPFPVAVCPLLLAGQNGISRDRTTEGQKSVTKGHNTFSRDRKAGQNVWDARTGTECLGSISTFIGKLNRCLLILCTYTAIQILIFTYRCINGLLFILTLNFIAGRWRAISNQFALFLLPNGHFSNDKTYIGCPNGVWVICMTAFCIIRAWIGAHESHPG